MAVFKAALTNELEKLYKKKKALAALLLSIAVIILGQLMIIGVRSGFGIRGAGSGEFPILVLSVVLYSILPLFIALVAIDSFSGEFAHNIIRIVLTRPVSRFKIFSAKVTAIALFVLFNLLLIFIFSTLAGFIVDYQGMTMVSIVKSFMVYVVSLLPLLVLALGIILLAQMIKSGISVFFITVLLFVASHVLVLIFPQYSSLLITTHIGWYKLWLAQPFPWQIVLREILLLVGYGIMLFVAAFYLFERKEF
ncbi:MAG: ABC transporter permease [Dehalobacterium sp.]|jgi:ABC-2 type transport system permease protein